jgi:hydroxymethylpyrimidine kinase/phosphomethylpyrimidine kinase
VALPRRALAAVTDWPPVLSVHAVDTAGDEGVVADAAVAQELRCRPLQVVTAVLAAGPERLHGLEEVSLAAMAQQFEAAMETARPRAVRIGVLRGAAQARLVAELLREYRLEGVVVAPASRGGRTPLIDDDTEEAIRQELYPLARVVVLRAQRHPPDEGEDLDPDALRNASAEARARGARAVLVAGARQRGRVLDLLDDAGSHAFLDAPRITAPRMAGLAGAHAAALTAHVARGATLTGAAEAAQRYVSLRLQRGR